MFTQTVQVPHQGFQVELCVSLMALHPQWVELRYGILTNGTQCVMIRGVLMMQLWCASNLGIEEQPLPIRTPILAGDQGKSYWMICNALEQRRLSSGVLIMDSTATTVGMGKMQV